MNQRGEITLVASLALLAFMGLVLLCALELKKSFHLLEKRTDLFLCTKEAKEELHLYMTFMGRTNWGIKNIHKVGLVMMFIPGLQGAAINAKKAKEYLKYTQNLRHISYLKTLVTLRKKECSLDPRMYKSPFKLSGPLLYRNREAALELVEETWTYIYLSKPYALTIKVDATGLESIHPKINYLAEEKLAILSSQLPSL